MSKVPLNNCCSQDDRLYEMPDRCLIRLSGTQTGGAPLYDGCFMVLHGSDSQLDESA
jgi:hypothetical protein